MGGTELKTDSSQRWMMYSKNAYGSGGMFLSAEQKKAVEEGKQFSQRAYADIWAKDSALVQRVRVFLGTHFHWHQRLANSGADLEVIQTLQSMIRGESVVLIAEQQRSGGAPATAIPAQPKIPSFRESLMTGYGMTYDDATAYIERYNVMADKINAALDRSKRAVDASASGTASDLTETANDLSDAQPFEYTPGAVNDAVEELAATTNNPKFAAKMLGYDQNTFSKMLHIFKPENGLRPSDNVIFHDDGSVEFDGQLLDDNIHNYAP